MATEETLQGFSMDQFLPPLVNLISCEVHKLPLSCNPCRP
jgi:hypothetical protein